MLFSAVTMATGRWPLIVLLLAMTKMLIVSSGIQPSSPTGAQRQHSTISTVSGHACSYGGLSAVLYKIHFKCISIRPTKYKLHFQIVFQMLFSITFEK